MRYTTLALEKVSAEVVQLRMTELRPSYAVIQTGSLICACKLSWPFVQIQMPRKLPEAAVMSHSMKRHCEALLTV